MNNSAISNLVAIDLISLMETMTKYHIGNDIRNGYFYFTISRYATDSNGFYIGYEYFTGKMKIYNKREFNITGLPLSIFPSFVIPSTMEIDKVIPATKDIEEYCGPDEDFAYSELEYHLKQCIDHLEEPTFDKEERSWSVGGFKEYI